ncbi:hypothetical protein [Pseudohoeflea suaedae]|nr:hypothetical protein [Pseudohoeflea suaedae]
MSTVTIQVDVDVDDILEAMTPKQTARLKDALEFGDNERQAAIDACAAIRRGDTMDALTILELEFFPKYMSEAAANEAYRKAMSG